MEFATASGTVRFESLWRTRESNDVPVNEMEDEHLVNTLSFLRRQLEENDGDGERLPFCHETRTEHNIEVITRELAKRQQ